MADPGREDTIGPQVRLLNRPRNDRKAKKRAMNAMEMFQLDGKAAVVTGGARGLGRQAALALAEAGPTWPSAAATRTAPRWSRKSRP